MLLNQIKSKFMSLNQIKSKFMLLNQIPRTSLSMNFKLSSLVKTVKFSSLIKTFLRSIPKILLVYLLARFVFWFNWSMYKNVKRARFYIFFWNALYVYILISTWHL